MKKQITALLTAISIAVPFGAAASAAGEARQMEYLDRGTVAVKSGSGVFLSWRLLGTENYDTKFDVYRGDTKIAEALDATNYTDTTAGASYTVVPTGESAASGKAVTVWDNQYITIPLDRPAGGTSLDGDEYTYSPNDITPADVDGDGEYELIIKWEPSNSFDSGKDACHSGNVYIDCYELSGEKLWRIDMGININAGAHFTQIAAYDFDLDGKAELAMKTAPGTKDGQGNYVSNLLTSDEIIDNTADYRHSERGVNDTGGRVMSGPEFYTVFQGDTGSALDTVYYPHPRGTVKEWGDDWGNRSERYLTGVAYLDGKTPSMLAWRGYYAKTTVTAYNLVDKKLVQVADFDTSKNGYGQFAGNGNHNLTVGDVDGDGCDEIICGALALDNDLSVLWCSGRGHGDALHLADYDPTHEGLEYFSVHEDYGGSKITGSTTGNDGQQHLGGMTLYKAENGEELFHVDSNSDQGRGMMAHVGYGDGYFELWGAGNYVSYGGTDVQKASYRPDSANQRVFWDSDTYDELFDGTGGNDSGSDAKISDDTGRVQSLRNVTTNNGTKNNAGLIADILGDWREEIVMRGQDDASLVVYTTTVPTEHKLYTLMHDGAYRMQVAAQNAGYNQPPHIGYYISENNDEYDARKTAAYVKTVHDGVTSVRDGNTPKPVIPFTAEAVGGKLTITNRTGKETDAVIYTARYIDGALEHVTRKDVTIPASGYKGDTDAQVGDTVFVWDANQKPLTDKVTVKAAPMPSPSPTPKPTPTPTVTPTPEPKSDFSVSNGVLTDYTGNDENVSVPPSVNGMTVTEIGEYAFNSCNQLKSVSLPDTITEISVGAFRNCGALASVELPSGLKTIGDRAFQRCGFAKIDIPETVTSIGGEAFSENENLVSVKIPAGVTALEDSIFSGCTSLSEITLSEGLETIGDSAFAGCSALERIDLPESVREIGDYAFGNSHITYFDSKNVEKMGSMVFWICTQLKEVVYREKLAEVGANSYYYDDIEKAAVYNREISENLPPAKMMYGYAGSGAEKFALLNNIPFYDIETGEQITKE